MLRIAFLMAIGVLLMVGMPVQAETAEVGSCDIGTGEHGEVIVACGEEGEACSVLDDQLCWSVRMGCNYLAGPMRELHKHEERFPDRCTTQPGGPGIEGVLGAAGVDSAAAASEVGYEVGSCYVGQGRSGEIVEVACGEAGEACSMLDDQVCWSVRIACSYLVGPLRAVGETIRRIPGRCLTQPGGPGSGLAAATPDSGLPPVEVGSCSARAENARVDVGCGEEDEACSVLDDQLCWSVRMSCHYLEGPLYQVTLILQIQPSTCGTQAGGLSA